MGAGCGGRAVAAVLDGARAARAVPHGARAHRGAARHLKTTGRAQRATGRTVDSSKARNDDGTPAADGAPRYGTVIKLVRTAAGILEQLTAAGHLFPLKPAWLARNG